MKTVLISVVAAVVAAVATVYVHHVVEEREARASGAVPAATAADGAASAVVPGAPLTLSYTTELVEDAWVNGARTTGLDHKPLVHADNSICYLTRVQIKGVQGPEDSSICRVEIDDFTGFWEVIAEVEEGGKSEVRCNARCLVWE
jgi:hypothetical protein